MNPNVLAPQDPQIPAPPQKGRFLVVEDDVRVTRALRREIGRHRRVEIAHTYADGRRRLKDEGPWTGVVLDVNLPDGSGLDLLAILRESDPLMPVLVLTGRLERHIANRTQALRAEYVCKPAGPDNIARFVAMALAGERVSERGVAELVADISANCKLTRRESEILSLAASGVSRADVASRLGVAENTAKAQIRTLLRKTGAKSLVDLQYRLMRDAHVN